MDNIFFLSLLLIILFMLSAFFSGSETALMTLDRYKLRHKAQTQHSAKLALKLLQTPDKLIGLILLGNNLVNIFITQLATHLGYLVGGSIGVAFATGALALLLLIFAELTPKTLATVKAEEIAFPAAIIYTPLLKITLPLVSMANFVANGILKKLGIDPENVDMPSVSPEELRTIVSESSPKIPNDHQNMILRVLDIESTTVEDIMIPKNNISGIDLSEKWDKIEAQLLNAQYTRLLLYRNDLEEILGFVHLRKILPLIKENKLDHDRLEALIRPPLYSLETIPLSQQLINFRHNKTRISLIVDEYGEIKGLLSLDDILDEIVGKISKTSQRYNYKINRRSDGSIWVDGGLAVRELRRITNIDLSSSEAKTLNGLIIEHLQSLPIQGVCVLINNYPVEVRKVTNNAVETLIIYPSLKQTL